MVIIQQEMYNIFLQDTRGKKFLKVQQLSEFFLEFVIPYVSQ